MNFVRPPVLSVAISRFLWALGLSIAWVGSQSPALAAEPARQRASTTSTHQIFKEQRTALASKTKRATRKPAAQASLGYRRDPQNRMSPRSRVGLQSAISSATLNSSAAMVVDQISGEVLFQKNAGTVLPIASITKLMTALVVAEANLPLDELLTVTQEDADLEKGVRSRLAVGTRLTRGEFMHLALMSSENRAAHLLGRNYPGGMGAFVQAMNIKAKQLGMDDSRFAEPTGLSASNVSSPRDLVRLVEESHRVEAIRAFSTARKVVVMVRGRATQFINSNALARGNEWALGLSKTGFIREAGRCLVMQAEVDSRPVIMVMLDASDKQQRLRDAELLRRWIIQQADQAPRSNPNA